MIDVFFTVDVEIWCNGWDYIDAKFPDAFQRYVYGRTPKDDYGLPYILRVLGDHGLIGVFFVEPLFSTRFGLDRLSEIVGLIRERRQEVQLHLHTEWVDESTEPILASVGKKRRLLRDFSLVEQTHLLALGRSLIERAGGGNANAFRAGSFGMNMDTLRALAANGIPFDSSYNASRLGMETGAVPGPRLVQPVDLEGVYEYPMTVFHDGMRTLRHAQLTACSYQELTTLLWQALESGYKAFIILSHNFELLNRTKSGADDTVVRRFQKLCGFLDRHRDCFRVRGFQDLTPTVFSVQPAPLSSPLWQTGLRMLEQAVRWRSE